MIMKFPTYQGLMHHPGNVGRMIAMHNVIGYDIVMFQAHTEKLFII